MDPIFSTLSTEEYDRLKDAIPLITILIAGADGKIDDKETSWAKKVTDIRSYSLPEQYRAYYLEIGETFSDRLNTLISTLPSGVEERSEAITAMLLPINATMEKLHPKVAADMYKEFVSFAKHVARASGGFLKFWSISAEEKRWIGLPMLKPFIHDEEE